MTSDREEKLISVAEKLRLFLLAILLCYFFEVGKL